MSMRVTTYRICLSKMIACAGKNGIGPTSHVFQINSNRLPKIEMKGEGVYLYDADGKDYFDGSGGAAVSCLGHGNHDIINAIKQQLDSMAFAHTGFLLSQPAEDLADLLVAHVPEGLEHVYFVSGGSKAVEAALKLAPQYFVELGQPVANELEVEIQRLGADHVMAFVADRDSKAVIGPAHKLNVRLKAVAFDTGLICYPMGGTIDGKHGDHVLLAPP